MLSKDRKKYDKPYYACLDKKKKKKKKKKKWGKDVKKSQKIRVIGTVSIVRDVLGNKV